MQAGIMQGRLAGTAGWDVVRLLLGVLLLAAAALKGHQLATEPVAGVGLLDSRWFLIAVSEFELAFGLWFLSGLFPKWTWRAAVLCFAGFGCVSLWKALSGEATCGCFGRVPVSPWYTVLLDVLAVTALLLWRRAPGRRVRPMPAVAVRVRVATLAVICLLVGIPAGVAMATHRGATLSETGEVLGDSEFVVLEPETWIGRRFPLLPYIDIGAELSTGRWIVVLYRPDCPACQEAIAEYGELARADRGRAGLPRIALVELPPYGDLAQFAVSPHSPCLLGRVVDAKEWFVSTPLIVTLQQGKG